MKRASTIYSWSVWSEVELLLTASACYDQVDAVLKGFLTDFPTVVGFVVINADGIPTKWFGP